MIERRTIFSACRRYRYTLWREWGTPADLLNPPTSRSGRRPDRSYVQFIGLNPSTADEVENDPTVRRCIDFATRWGFGALCMTNAFSFRSTDPEAMKREPQPNDIVGRTTLYCPNDEWLMRCAKEASLVVAAWGKDGRHLNRESEILKMFEAAGIQMHCLGTNKDGTPKHPLYLLQTLTPIPFAKGKR